MRLGEAILAGNGWCRHEDWHAGVTAEGYLINDGYGPWVTLREPPDDKPVKVLLFSLEHLYGKGGWVPLKREVEQ